MVGIAEFFEHYQSVIYPSAIALFAAGYKIYTGIKKKHAELMQADTEKNQIRNKEKFKEWEHNESILVISRIQKMCNVYKDKSSADRVAYLQLENGTLAMSKLCNMFISCLCEDTRYSACPKEIRNLQRIPYSRLAAWIEAMNGVAVGNESRYLISHSDSENLRVINEVYTLPVNMQLAAPVFDYNSVFVGVVVFDYKQAFWDEANLQSQLDLLIDFRASVYGSLITYHESRKEKQAELRVKE